MPKKRPQLENWAGGAAFDTALLGACPVRNLPLGKVLRSRDTLHTSEGSSEIVLARAGTA